LNASANRTVSRSATPQEQNAEMLIGRIACDSRPLLSSINCCSAGFAHLQYSTETREIVTEATARSSTSATSSGPTRGSDWCTPKDATYPPPLRRGAATYARTSTAGYTDPHRDPYLPAGRPVRVVLKSAPSLLPDGIDRPPAQPVHAEFIVPCLPLPQETTKRESGRRDVDLDYRRRGGGRLAWCLQRLWIPLGLDGLRRDSVQQTEGGPRGPAREDPLGLAGT
jgi:hypothetical protein